MLKDSFGRIINYLRVSITDRCNYRCLYCMPERGVEKREHSDIMSFEEIYNAVAAAVSLGVTKVRISGGEPLARRGVIELCRSLGSLGAELVLTTNGSMLAPVAGELAAAGVRRVNISLDTLRPDRFRRLTRGGELADVLAGLDAAAGAGLTPVKINAVLIRGFNDDEIEEIAGLTVGRPIEARFIELMPIGEASKLGGYIPSEEAISRLTGAERLGRSGVAELYRLPGAVGTVGFISPVSCSFCASCGRLRLTADGFIKPCLHSRAEIPVRGLRGDELEEAFRAAAAAKPRDHGGLSAGRASHSARGMDRIGG